MLPITSPPEQHPYSISSSPTPTVCSLNNKLFSTSQLAYQNCYYSRIFFCTIPAIGNIKHLFSCFFMYYIWYILTSPLITLALIFSKSSPFTIYSKEILLFYNYIDIANILLHFRFVKIS